MKIIVTAEDIKEGLRVSAEYCPIALAAQRAGLCEYPLVGERRITCLHAVYRLPIEACNFIFAFDRYEAVEPFEFDIDILTQEAE
jgi:hypothetical protein